MIQEDVPLSCSLCNKEKGLFVSFPVPTMTEDGKPVVQFIFCQVCIAEIHDKFEDYARSKTSRESLN